MQMWAGVSFSALGGQTADFLQRAAMQHFRLRCIYPTFGGVIAQCSAREYASLAKVAKTCHVRLQICKRRGAYFALRGLLRRKGVWVAMLLFCAFLFVQQNLIWYVDGSALSYGQRTRVAEILWEKCGIAAGTYSSETLLAQAEEVLISDTHEFSWVSLNFAGGRLTIEGNVARPVPQIEQGVSNDVVASTSGEIVQVNVEQGTAMVIQGQMVVEGQTLIGMARLEHDRETLNYTSVRGQVLAKFNVMDTVEIQKNQSVYLPQAPIKIHRSYQVLAFGHLLELPCLFSSKQKNENLMVSMQNDTTMGDALVDNMQQNVNVNLTDRVTVRRIQPDCLGFFLPITVIETGVIHYLPSQVQYSSEQAFALAELSCKNSLYQQYPDAVIETQQVAVHETDGSLTYTVCYQVIADIAV